MTQRIIESRNKREGGYIGKTRYCRKNGRFVSPKHARVGSSMAISLRDWSRA
jgi:hypothetical protein